MARTAGTSGVPRMIGRLWSWVSSPDATVAIGVSVAFFLTFEIWFSVPLPKGPLEAALGLN